MSPQTALLRTTLKWYRRHLLRLKPHQIMIYVILMSQLMTIDQKKLDQIIFWLRSTTSCIWLGNMPGHQYV